MPRTKHISATYLVEEGYSPGITDRHGLKNLPKPRSIRPPDLENFLKEQNVEPPQITSFLNGISRLTDNHFEHEIIECSSGAVVKRFGAISSSGHPLGRFFTLSSVEDLASIGLGEFYIDANGTKQQRQAHHFILKQPALFIVTYAKRLTDNFSIPGENQQTTGGEVQYFLISPMQHLICIDHSPLLALKKSTSIKYGMQELYNAVITSAFIEQYHPLLREALQITKTNIEPADWLWISREQIIEQLLTIRSEELLRLLTGLQINFADHNRDSHRDYHYFDSEQFNDSIFAKLLTRIESQTNTQNPFDLSKIDHYNEVTHDAIFMQVVSERITETLKNQHTKLVYLLAETFRKNKLTTVSSLLSIILTIQKFMPGNLDRMERNFEDGLPNFSLGNHFTMFKVYLSRKYREHLEQISKPIVGTLVEMLALCFNQNTRWTFAIPNQISISISKNDFVDAINSLYFVNEGQFIPGNITPEQLCVVKDVFAANRLKQQMLHPDFGSYCVFIKDCINHMITESNQPELALGFLNPLYRLFDEKCIKAPDRPIKKTPQFLRSDRYASEAQLGNLILSKDHQQPFCDLFMSELAVLIDSQEPLDIESVFDFKKIVPDKALSELLSYLTVPIHQAEEYLFLDLESYLNNLRDTDQLLTVANALLGIFNHWQKAFPDMVAKRLKYFPKDKEFKSTLWDYYHEQTLHKLEGHIQRFRQQYIDFLSECVHTASLWITQKQTDTPAFELSSSPFQSKHSRAVVLYQQRFFGMPVTEVLTPLQSDESSKIGNVIL